MKNILLLGFLLGLSGILFSQKELNQKDPQEIGKTAEKLKKKIIEKKELLSEKDYKKLFKKLNRINGKWFRGKRKLKRLNRRFHRKLNRYEAIAIQNALYQNQGNGKQVIDPIDPSYFINIYETKSKVGKARLIKSRNVSPFPVIGIDSKISIDFDIKALSEETKFFGSLSLRAYLNDREIEIASYSMVGQEYTPIGSNSGFSTRDFASSLVGVLAEADKFKEENWSLIKLKKDIVPGNWSIDYDNFNIYNEKNNYNESNTYLLQVQTLNKDFLNRIIDQNDYLKNKIEMDSLFDQQAKTDFVKVSKIRSTHFIKFVIDEISRDYYILDKLVKDYPKFWDSNKNLKESDGLMDSLNKQRIYYEVKLVTEVNLFDSSYSQLTKNYNYDLYNSTQKQILKDSSSLLKDSIENLQQILPTYNGDSVSYKAEVKDLMNRKVKWVLIFQRLETINKLVDINTQSISNQDEYNSKLYRISKQIDVLSLFVDKKNISYADFREFIAYGTELKLGLLKYYHNRYKIYVNENENPRRLWVNKFINLNKLLQLDLKLISRYIAYLEKTEAEASALSKALKQSPVLIANIIDNLKSSMGEMEVQLKIIDSLYQRLDLVKSNDNLISAIETYNYNFEKVSLSIEDLNEINDGYVKNYFYEFYNLSGKQTQLKPFNDRIIDKNKSLNKDVFGGTFYKLIKENVYHFADSLINKISMETGEILYQSLKTGEIFLDKESPKEGDMLQIDLLWNKGNNPNNKESKPSKITLARLKTKTTGWDTKVSDAFFLVYNINADNNNPDLVKSIFSGAAGITLLRTYHGDGSSFHDYYPHPKFNKDRYIGTESRKFFKKDIGNFLQPSFGLNISYLNFSNTENFEVGTGITMGLFNNSVMTTIGYNLNLAPSKNALYWGLGFSFVDLASKFKN